MERWHIMRMRSLMWRILLAMTALVGWSLSTSAKVEQYKKDNRDAIAEIAEGKPDKAIEHFQNYLKDNPGDLESYYGLTVAYTVKGEMEEAIRWAEQGLSAGLPVSRLWAGPRSLLGSLQEREDFLGLVGGTGTVLLHGPMLGRVTHSRASIWVRTSHEAEVRVFWGEKPGLEDGRYSREVKTLEKQDFTGIVSLRGLKPRTRYIYKVVMNGEPVGEEHSFQTFAKTGESLFFSVGFGGGAGYTPQHERMWNTVKSRHPEAFLLLGDNVYIDHPTLPDVQRYCYYRRQSRPEYRRFISSTPIYSIWDDHDFTTNDGWGGPDVDNPSWKIPVWELFRQNWVNPAYGEGVKAPGCWYEFNIGDVQFIMLDGRYYRTNPRERHASMLGPVQKEWLFETLLASKSTFIVLASPVPWSQGTKPGSLDTWDGFPEEREEIFEAIEKHRIEGIILLSADRHRSDHWVTERHGCYPLHEFESSKLTNIHTHQAIQGALFSYNEKCSFGLLHFDTGRSDPEVYCQFINIDDEQVYRFLVKRSQLSFPRK